MKDINEAMKSLKENEKELLWEMTNIRPRVTGLKTLLYSTPKRKYNNYPHGSRIKVELTNKELFPIMLLNSGSIEPINKNGEYNKLKQQDKNIINNAIKYVEKWHDAFLAHWNAKIGDIQLSNVLKKVVTLSEAIKDAEENGLE